MKYIKKYWIVIVISFGLSMFFKPALCPLILGSLILYMGVMAILFQNKLRTTGVAATGRILSYNVSRKGHKTPVVEFEPLVGVPVSGEPTIYTSTNLSILTSSSNMIGNEILVLYDPDDPQKFILGDDKGFNYIILAIFVLAGLIFIAVSISSLLGYIEIG